MVLTACHSDHVLATTREDHGDRPLSSPVLIIVEGIHDVEFLRRLTANLYLVDASIPDLGAGEQAGLVVFVPFGGGSVLAWSSRFAPLRHREFHLYDREIAPETPVRQEALDRINRRPNCHALLLRKRALENYLHTAAIVNAGGGMVVVNDEESMALAVARNWYHRQPQACSWDALTPRARRRMAARAKRWLNTVAVNAMTPGMLHQRDPAGELLAWLRKIAVAVDGG
jgi:hypothetical protein